MTMGGPGWRAIRWPIGVLLVLAGTLAASRLPLVQRAPLQRPHLAIAGYWPGASALLVERELTAPVERALQGVHGLRSVGSVSREGSTALDLTLDRGADVAWVRMAIREQLERLRPTFPEGVSPLEVAAEEATTGATRPLALVTLTGPRTTHALGQLLAREVAPRLRALPGVARVTVVGADASGTTVTVDPMRLQAHGLTPAAVLHALAEAGEVVPVGVARGEASDRPVRLDERPRSEAALRRVPLVGRHGQYTTLGSIAGFRETADARGRFHRVDGQPVVGLEIAAHPSDDPRAVLTRVQRALAAIRRTLPAGLALRVARDGTAALSRELVDVGRCALVGAVGLLLLAGWQARSGRAAGWALHATACGVGATMVTLALWRRPVPMASLVVLALAIGPLATLAWREAAAARHPDGGAVAWYRTAPGAALMATCAVPVPFLPEGPRVVLGPPVYALLLYAWWHAAGDALPGAERAVAGRWSCRRRHKRPHAPLRLLRHPAWAFSLTGLFTIGVYGYGVGGAASVARESDHTGATTLRVELHAERGTDPALLHRVLQPLEQLALAHPGVLTTHASGAGSDARLEVEFSPAARRTLAPATLQAQVVDRATRVGGMQLLVQGIGPAFHLGGQGGSQSAVRLELAGYGWEPLDSLAAALVDRLARLPRVRDLRLSSAPWREDPPGRDLLATPDRMVLAQLGLSVDGVAATIAGVTAGPLGRVRLPIDGEEQFVSIRERLGEAPTLEGLRAVPLVGAGGRPIRVRHVAAFHERPAPSAIVREAQRYVRYLHYEIRGTPRQAQQLQATLRRSVAPPPGFSVTERQAAEEPEREDAMDAPWRGAVLGILLASLMAAMVHNRIRSAGIVLMVLPAVLAGALAGRTLLGAALTPEALAGLVLAGGTTARLALVPRVSAADIVWVVAGAAVSAVPFLLLGGPDTPGRLIAAVALGGIVSGAVAVALLARWAHGADPDPLCSPERAIFPT